MMVLSESTCLRVGSRGLRIVIRVADLMSVHA